MFGCLSSIRTWAAGATMAAPSTEQSPRHLSQGTHPAHLYAIFTLLRETQIPSKCGSRYDHASTRFEARCAMRSESSRDDARVPLEVTRSARSRYGLQIILWTL